MINIKIFITSKPSDESAYHKAKGITNCQDNN